MKLVQFYKKYQLKIWFLKQIINSSKHNIKYQHKQEQSITNLHQPIINISLIDTLTSI